MNRLNTLLFLGLVLLAYMTMARPAFPEEMSAAAARGKQVYQEKCMVCHQPNGEGLTGLAPALNDKTYLSSKSDEEMREAIVKGRPGTVMVGFESLGKEKIDDLVAFIRHWESETPEATPEQQENVPFVETSEVVAGDTSRGEEVFNRHCLSCHQDITNFLASTKPGGIVPVVNSVHRQTSLAHDFSGAYTWAGLSEEDKQAMVAFLKNNYGKKKRYRQAAQPKEAAEPTVAAAKETTAAELQASEEEIFQGQELFQGKIPFAKGGPSCISCHDVQNRAVIGGGSLSKEVTDVFSRMGEPGVKVILKNPPFPVMKEAYRDKELTDDEVQSLISFLAFVDREKENQEPKDYGRSMLVGGLLGTGILFILYGLLGLRRKKKSVNQDVFNRQKKLEP